MSEFVRRALRLKPRKTGLGLLLVPVLCLSGCAATSTFTSYPSQINPLLNTVQTKQPIDFGTCLLSETQSKDGILYDMERGRLAQILGKVDVSMQDFSAAMERLKENDDKAKISLSDLGATMAATALNDNALPYRGAGFERVMLHHYQALNYLTKNDLEGAGVEVRRANAEQEDALKRHEEEIEEAQRKAQEKKVVALAASPAISTAYAHLDEVAGKVKNSFQNAYTFYLSGFIYEALQQPNDAYIDYKKALEIFPDNSYLQKDVLRLAKQLNMSEDLDALQGRFSLTAPCVPSNSGDLLILFEDGFVPQKTEVKIPLPVPNLGFLAVAFPVYRDSWSAARTLTVEEEGVLMGTTEPICDFRALSVKALKEQVPMIATRQAARLVAKGVTAKIVKEKLGSLGQLGVTIWNLASENADLRSWVSLPANAQVLRVALTPGTHRLRIRVEGEAAPATVEVNVAAGSRKILHVVRAGRELYSALLPQGQDQDTKMAVSSPAAKLTEQPTQSGR